ncbi:MAG: hypothetical protein ABIO63_04830, partial [Casimicrobiaceae bacterium]
AGLQHLRGQDNLTRHADAVAAVALACPGCRAPMTPVELDRVPLGALTVDLCAPCQALWFDAMESLQLSPAGTLILFRAIHEAGSARGVQSAARLPCPRCETPLDLTQDIQRSTRFNYYRCRRGHGRFTPFAQFLREKNFIKPVSAAELARLKALVRVVQCSSCGAPVDIEHDAACRYCRAPVAILDTQAVARTLRELDQAAAQRAAVSNPGAAAAAVIESARFERAMADESRHANLALGIDVVGVGLAMLSALVSR